MAAQAKAMFDRGYDPAPAAHNGSHGGGASGGAGFTALQQKMAALHGGDNTAGPSAVPSAGRADPIDCTSVHMAASRRPTTQLKTSNIANYRPGQAKHGLGLQKQHNGIVLSVEADTPGATSGPGVVTIELI